jgi:phosphoglycolate phosphatase
MRNFDLLVLDFDGTLADSEALLVGLVNDTLAAHGLPRADHRLVARQIGSPLPRVFRQSTDHLDDETLARLCAHYRLHADSMDFVRRFRLFPRVRSTLAALHEAGAHLVIGTSKGHATTCDIIRHCGLDDLVAEIIGGDSVTQGKPHPEMIDRARALFETPRQRTLMVGDSIFDIEMGHAAGVATCAAAYGMQEPETLRALQPRFVIERIDQLICLVVTPP